MRILGEEKSALKAGMDSLDGWLHTVKLLIGIATHLHDRRLHIGLPSWITLSMLHTCTGKEEMCLHLSRDIMLARLYRATLACRYYNCIVGCHLYRGKVSGCLHKTLKITAH